MVVRQSPEIPEDPYFAGVREGNCKQGGNEKGRSEKKFVKSAIGSMGHRIKARERKNSKTTTEGKDKREKL